MKMRIKKQMEMPGLNLELENALNDLIELLDEREKITETIPEAKKRVAELMEKYRKDKIRHGGRSITLTEGKVTDPTIRICKKE